jgi:hypothetical protein
MQNVSQSDYKEKFILILPDYDRLNIKRFSYAFMTPQGEDENFILEVI